MDSKLAAPQKIHLYNTSVVPAAAYILGNLYPNEQQRSSLLKCRKLDTEVRKVLVKGGPVRREGLKRYSTTRASVYLPN